VKCIAACRASARTSALGAVSESRAMRASHAVVATCASHQASAMAIANSASSTTSHFDLGMIRPS
jgi:hypothetical protein